MEGRGVSKVSGCEVVVVASFTKDSAESLWASATTCVRTDSAWQMRVK